MYQLHTFDKAAEALPTHAAPTEIAVYRIGDDADHVRSTIHIPLSNLALIASMGALCWAAVCGIAMFFV